MRDTAEAASECCSVSLRSCDRRALELGATNAEGAARTAVIFEEEENDADEDNWVSKQIHTQEK